jgi:hypothetical protein
MLGGIRDAIAWARSGEFSEDRLKGDWVPDSREQDAAYAASLVFDQAEVWFLTRQSDGLRQHPRSYRVVEANRLLIRDRDRFMGKVTGRPWPTDFRFEADDVLVFGGRRYLRTDDPDDRAWPPGLGMSPQSGGRRVPWS